MYPSPDIPSMVPMIGIQLDTMHIMHVVMANSERGIVTIIDAKERPNVQKLQEI